MMIDLWYVAKMDFVTPFTILALVEIKSSRDSYRVSGNARGNDHDMDPAVSA